MVLAELESVHLSRIMIQMLVMTEADTGRSRPTMFSEPKGWILGRLVLNINELDALMRVVNTVLSFLLIATACNCRGRWFSIDNISIEILHQKLESKITSQ